jgi:hypothetical protein
MNLIRVAPDALGKVKALGVEGLESIALTNKEESGYQEFRNHFLNILSVFQNVKVNIHAKK